MHPKDNFIGISYEVWRETVSSYFKLSHNITNKYLQWYPFTKSKMEEKLLDYDFYTKYIKTGYIFFDNQVIEINNNYLQKPDGTYRQSQLISPTLYIIIETICKEIYLVTKDNFQTDHALYAGDLEQNELSYSSQYDLFFKEVNKLASLYPYYMKFDLRDYFRNIDINLLFNFIENETDDIPQFYIFLYKQLLEYIGDGRYPVIENSVGLSYLATKVYLREADEKNKRYLSLDNDIQTFKLIRYVDDLYIFFEPKQSDTNIQKIFNNFKSYYISILRDLKLTLNVEKSTVKNSRNINEDLKQSFYGGEIYDRVDNIHSITIDYYVSFLTELCSVLVQEASMTIEEYHEIVERSFDISDIELDAREIYNYIIFNLSEEFLNNSVIIGLLNNMLDSEIVKFDIKKIVTAVLNTKDGTLIKKLLNSLFEKEPWDDNDEYISIVYLLQRNFAHDDLKAELKNSLKLKSLNLYEYIEAYCEGDLSKWLASMDDWFMSIQAKDFTPTTMQMYFLYKKALAEDSILLAHSYLKTFFDRITAELVFKFKLNPSDLEAKEPNYNNYHTEGALKRIYQSIDGSDEIIKKAHDIRNSNPIVHASAEVIAKDSIKYSKSEILKSIENLKSLVIKLIKGNYNK